MPSWLHLRWKLNHQAWKFALNCIFPLPPLVNTTSQWFYLLYNSSSFPLPHLHTFCIDFFFILAATNEGLAFTSQLKAGD
jgi:hypothetical protein